MPSFRPPLGQTTAALVHSAAQSPFVKLTFIAELGEHEHIDGVIEIWTNLPNVDEEGKPLHGQEEWHAIPFSDGAWQGSIPRQQRIAIASPIIPSHHATYSYTYRITRTSGHVDWLGSGGDNGTVEVKDGAEADDTPSSGTWDGLMASSEETQAKGFAIDQDAPEGSAITCLPSVSDVNAHVVVLSPTANPNKIPFAIPTKQINAVAESESETTLVVATKNGTLQVSAGTSLPKQQDDLVFSRNKSLAVAMESVSTQCGEEGSAFWALLKGSVGETDSERFIALGAGTETCDIPIEPSFGYDLLLVRDMTARTASVHNCPTLVHLPAAFSAKEVVVTGLLELRGMGSDSSVWLCAPTGKLVQTGETEVEDGERPIVHVPASPAQLAKAIHLHEEQTAAQVAAPAPDTDSITNEVESSATEGNDAPDHVTDADFADDEDDDSSTIRPTPSPKPQSKSFLSAIARLFARFWTWLMTPVGKIENQTPRRSTARIEDDGERDTHDTTSEADTILATPGANERTPLLQTPELSRSTSASVFSPLASPPSGITIKAQNALDEYAKSIKTPNTDTMTDPFNYDAVNIANQNDNDDGTMTPTQDIAAPHVSSKAFAHFAFTLAPPFSFFVWQQDESGGLVDEVKFSFKQDGKGWEGVEAVRAKGKGWGEEVVELVIAPDAAGGGQGQGWEVRVQRV